MATLKSFLSKVGNAVKTAATKVGEVLKVAAPAALSIVSKNVPGGSFVQTVAASLINKTNAPAASPVKVQEAKEVLISPPAIGQFQGSGAVVKSIDGKVSVPINGNAIGQFASIAPLAAVVTSGHLINPSGNVIQKIAPQRTSPAGAGAPSQVTSIAAQASTVMALPSPSPLQKIQDIVGIINQENPPAPTNAPKETGSSEMPTWVWIVLGVTGVGLLLLIISSFKRRR